MVETQYVVLIVNASCLRYSAPRIIQLMSDLPAYRINPGFPFAISGIDYASPFKVFVPRVRTKTIIK